MALAAPREAVSERQVKVVKILHNPFTAWIILCLSLILTVVAWWVSTNITKQRARDRFDFRVVEIAKAIKDRMHVYEQVLWGGVGLFNTNQDISRAAWHEYVKTLHINVHWPGIQGIGFSIPVKKEDKARHIQAIRAEGFPNYTIKPETDRDTYSAIIYLEPFDWRNQRAFGYDMWSNDMRRAAMTRARDEGVAATSGIITLVQETNEDVQRGFLTYLPVYQKGMPTDTIAARRRAFVGWVYSPFRAGDLMKGILGSKDKNYEFEIFDNTDMTKESLLFYSSKSFHLLEESHSPIFSTTVNLEFQGHPWLLYINTKTNNMTSGEIFFPKMIAVCGFIIDILLFYVIFSIYSLQKRAVTIAKDMTKELEVQKQDLSKSNEELERFAYISSHDLKSPLRAIDNLSLWIEEDSYDELSEDSRNNLKELRKRVQRMQLLIDGLLDFARLGRKDFQYEDTNTHELLREILEIEEIPKDFCVDITDTMPVFHAKKQLLSHVFSNLISNAVKHHDKPASEAWVRITCQEQNGFHEFTISDNGPGIPKTYHEKSFQMFQTIKPRDEVEGSGLGLAMVKKIVETEGGMISLDSDAGQGATFRFTWPQRVEADS